MWASCLLRTSVCGRDLKGTSGTQASRPRQSIAVFAVKDGEQPITHSAITLVANGEIYNHEALKADPSVKDKAYTASDCSGIIAAYETYGKSSMCQVIQALDGFFVFVLHDGETDTVLAARDPFGITSIAAKALLAINGAHIYNFPPGSFYHSAASAFSPDGFHRYAPVLSDIPIRAETDAALVRETLCTAVKKRLMVEAPFGVLLSGGLDSSLIASIAARLTRDTHGPLKTYSIGLKGAPDHIAALQVAAHIKSDHTAFEFTVDQALDALPDVIRHLETFDITTIRASTPMYLLSKYIKTQGLKMVLSGEGSDELFGGYLYFHSAPSDKEFHDECVGLEAVLSLPIASRRPLPGPSGKPIEKYLLRDAFRGDWLPDEILWRAKEQFSDGVGFSWIDSLKQTADLKVTDVQFADRANTFPNKTPATKEAYWYRCMFNDLFGDRLDLADTVELWVPRGDWGCPSDPSGRAQAVHTDYKPDTME
ncbi:asparagine synthase (glutamine-hydrolyzing) [Batrachochytrium salamandrivorans]|nr:asparagine synthase (glutamine-hydrolyzing) [Batrachochytrium salamandrivorans]